MSIVSKAFARLRTQASPGAVGPIGIDFALDGVHLVQLEKRSATIPNVRARATRPFDCARQEILHSPHRFRALIRDALASDRFVGRKAVIAIPSGMFRTVSVNYRCAAGRDAEAAAVLKVMKDRLDGELSDFVIDYMPVNSRSKNDERLALVAVSERQPIVEFLTLASRARLTVEALEIGPVAICRLVGAIAEETGADNTLVINSGRRASYLTLISGNELLFDQEVSFGENSLIQHAAESLDMPEDMVRDSLLQSGVQSGSTAAASDAELASTLSEILKPEFLRLVEEIKRVCMYAAAETRGGAVTQFYLLGSVARWPGSDVLLQNMTGVAVAKIPNPLALFHQSDTDNQAPDIAAPEIAVATGAALRGMLNDG